jgi:hypothetical protein
MASSEEDLSKIPWHSFPDNAAVLAKLGTSLDGLSPDEAAARLAKCARRRRPSSPHGALAHVSWERGSACMPALGRSAGTLRQGCWARRDLPARRTRAQCCDVCAAHSCANGHTPDMSVCKGVGKPTPRVPRPLASDACPHPHTRRYGPNALTPPKKAGFFAKLWSQLNNVLIFILLAAAVVVAGLQARRPGALPRARRRPLVAPGGRKPRHKAATLCVLCCPAEALPDTPQNKAKPKRKQTKPTTRRSGSRWASSSG